MTTSQSDLERLGIFKELSYVNIGDEYKDKKNIFTSLRVGEVPRSKEARPWIPNGKSGGTLNPFERAQIGVYVSSEHENTSKYAKKRFAAWKPSNVNTEWPSTPHWEITIPRETKKYPLKGQPANKTFLVSYPKKGTGYGYLDITINKYPERLPTKSFNYMKSKSGGEKRANLAPFRPVGNRVEGLSSYEIFHGINPLAQRHFKPFTFRDANTPEAKKMNPSPFVVVKTDKNLLGMIGNYPEHSINESKPLRSEDTSIKKNATRWVPPRTCTTYYPTKSTINKNIDICYCKHKQNIRCNYVSMCTREK